MKNKQKEKSNTFEIINTFYEGRELTLNAFKSGIFLFKQHKEKDSKY